MDKAEATEVRTEFHAAVKMTPHDLQSGLDTYEHMRTVNGYVSQHLEQNPKDVEHSRWRYSLMNWGQHPLKT